jgi:leader peptidase (prepilin peptidase)/N-methyltransferase
VTCEATLGARQLVPVVSFAVQRGRCRHCAAPIARRYPAVEVLLGALFALLGLRFGVSAVLPAYLLLAAVLTILAVIDLDTLKLPRQLVWFGLAAGVPLLVAASLLDGSPGRLVDAAIGAGAAFGVALAIHLCAPRGLGFGDVRLALLIGVFLGWLGLAQLAVGGFLAVFSGAVVGIGLVLCGRAGRRTALPFGPFLAAGTLATVLMGPGIVRIWLGP